MADVDAAPPPTTDTPAPEGALTDALPPPATETPATEAAASGALTDTPAPAADGTEPPAAEVVAADDAPAPPLDLGDFSLPEGVEVDAEGMTQFKSLLADPKLDLSGAEGRKALGQRLLDLQVERERKVGSAINDVYVQTRKGWADEVKADPEIGGPNLPRTLSVVARTIDILPAKVAKEFREALAYTGAGDNPATIRALHHLGLALTESGHVGGKPVSEQPRSAASRIYPDLPTIGR